MKTAVSAAERKRVYRALAELDGTVSEPMHPARTSKLLGAAMDRYLGPATMSIWERWNRLSFVEVEMLLEALEERAAIVNDGPWRPTVAR